MWVHKYIQKNHISSLKKKKKKKKKKEEKYSSYLNFIDKTCKIYLFIFV